MDTIPGDTYVRELAKYIRLHEAKFGDAGKQAGRKPGGTSSLWTPTTWVGLSNDQAGASRPAKPMLLKLNLHNLFYLLVRFEGLGIGVGQLDVRVPGVARPASYFSFVSASSKAKDDDAMSMSSLRSTMSAMSSLSLGSKWWGAASAPPDPTQDTKYLYASFTKIPALRLGPTPGRLIENFEDYPGDNAVPLDSFKNLQVLETEDVDPRTLLGWDRLSMQLRSLTIKKSGVEDVTELLVDSVFADEQRRRDIKPGRKMRKVHSSQPAEETSKPSNADADAGAAPLADEDVLPSQAASSPPLPKLPSLAWHFLRYLSLSDNSLTFVPSTPLIPLAGLTHLDLSSNLLVSVPPALANLPSLISLNLTDNMIESLLGIKSTLPSIRVLNLARNRLESLCGLERLLTLRRIDLRANAVIDAGEVGRLATLPGITEVWAADNPLAEEYPDWRVECFVHFAKEGRSIVLDGEGPGWFERQRIAERVPRPVRRDRKDRENEAQTSTDAARTASPPIKSVKHHGTHQTQRTGKEGRKTATARVQSLSPQRRAEHGLELGLGGPTTKTRKPRPSDASSTKGVAASILAERQARRRNRRIVDLDGAGRQEGGGAGTGTEESEFSGMSDSDAVKHAALSGRTSLAASPRLTTSSGHGMVPGKEGKPVLSAAHTLTRKTSAEVGVSRDTSPARNAVASTSANGSPDPGASIRSLLSSPGTGNGSGRAPISPKRTANRLGRSAHNRMHSDNARRLLPEDDVVVSNARLAKSMGRSSTSSARRARVSNSLYETPSSPPPVGAIIEGDQLSSITGEGGSAMSPPRGKASGAMPGSEAGYADGGEGEGGGNGRSEAFRRRIEALKNEVGDDWLRMIARGDYGPDGQLTTGKSAGKNLAKTLKETLKDVKTNEGGGQAAQDAAPSEGQGPSPDPVVVKVQKVKKASRSKRAH